MLQKKSLFPRKSLNIANKLRIMNYVRFGHEKKTSSKMFSTFPACTMMLLKHKSSRVYYYYYSCQIMPHNQLRAYMFAQTPQ